MYQKPSAFFKRKGSNELSDLADCILCLYSHILTLNDTRSEKARFWKSPQSNTSLGTTTLDNALVDVHILTLNDTRSEKASPKSDHYDQSHPEALQFQQYKHRILEVSSTEHEPWNYYLGQ
eukprot:scaffold5247_cov130-Cylindrotheca_fusiformis.AAC.2